MKKIFLTIISACFAASSLQATLLFQDSTNYPYTSGCIEGQGQWYCFYPKSPYLDAGVTNNILYLNTSNHDEVGTPTNGWSNDQDITFASFTINVTQLPSTTNGSYFVQLQNNGDTNDLCHLFIDTIGTQVPGTYRLGIANFDTSFSALTPPNNYPMDLAPGVNYTVVIQFDEAEGDPTPGSWLWINPSAQDYMNALDQVGLNINNPGQGDGFVFATDSTGNGNINITQIGFSPYADAEISNVMAGNDFDDVNTTNLPVFGIQPQSQTNYSGNGATFYSVASGVDLQYQWYSSGGALEDGENVSGATNDTLTVTNLSDTDYYYVVVTDAYQNKATSAYATNTVITTPTAPFFTNAPVNVTNNLFTGSGFTNLALGTGPLIYQWYFAPTNLPITYAPLQGATAPSLNVFLTNYSYGGSYFVVASNAVDNGSIAYGPTNTLTVIAPLVATMAQLHTLLLTSSNLVYQNENGTYYINQNNVNVSGYVSVFSGYGSTYSEFWIQDATGLGCEVYLGGLGNTNTPPIGTYVTVSGPLEVYHTALELAPTTQASIITNAAPPVTICPVLGNGIFSNLVNHVLSSNALEVSDSLVTFTNVYIYGNKTGGALGSGGTHYGVGGVFYPNSYTELYFTVGGPYSSSNTNVMEIFQPTYNIGGVNNPFNSQTIPTFCYQLTGVYSAYGPTAQLTPSRLADYVTNPPPAFSTTITESNGVPTLNWGPVQAGSTYSANTAAAANRPWTITAQGLAYYPTNGAFTDTNLAPSKLYLISSP